MTGWEAEHRRRSSEAAARDERINKARWAATELWMKEAKAEDHQILPPSLDVLLDWMVTRIRSLESSLELDHRLHASVQTEMLERLAECEKIERRD